ncbi:hypothetical protein [Pontibacter chinhatensis]|uniref:EF hand n=1 Tax=Pontibacter chinhatensis TaxID=1436961 RepID=A0A1I2VJX4_9BACT|nr:hypothetical protein [Pontibacter chinhatensis]SFG88527.1 hypothetical protein SAMN05421739_104190 [Pontibacter chinhatensis]
MKNFYLVSLLLLSITFMSCDDDDESNSIQPTDTEQPELNITTTLGIDTFLIIESIELKIKVEDNMGIKDTRVYLADPEGTRSMVLERTEPYLRNAFRELDVSIPLGKDSPTGTYTVMVEAVDQAQNMVKDSTTVTVHASALGRSEFSRIVSNINNITVLHAMDWFGYNLMEGIQFNEAAFNLGFFLIANTNLVATERDFAISHTEWENFVTDFNVEGEDWATWDADKDNLLNNVEFDQMLSKLNLFSEWDTDKNALIKGEELGSGIFDHWDNNQDGLLTRYEYMDKFYTYLDR